jgi:hypothetical protein
MTTDEATIRKILTEAAQTSHALKLARAHEYVRLEVDPGVVEVPWRSSASFVP